MDMTHYFATVLPGLESILLNEIRVKIADADVQAPERGKVFFRSGLSVEVLKCLRTADNLYRLIHRFEVGPHKLHLAGIESEISRLSLSCVLPPARSGTVQFKVNASRAGKHTYSRFDAAEAAMRGIASSDRRFRPNGDGTHEAEFRLDIREREAVFALRLTDAAFRYRAEQRSFAPAALRPTVAHALVWLSKPSASDVFADPCCGSGTILAERLAYPYCRIQGGDRSPEAVAAALENTGNLAVVRQWDARRLPLDAGSIDVMVTNLPFGRQILSDVPLPDLYRELLREAHRVLGKSGRYVCLTDAKEALQGAAELSRFDCKPVSSLSLKGLHPTLFVLEKMPG